MQWLYLSLSNLNLTTITVVFWLITVGIFGFAVFKLFEYRRDFLKRINSLNKVVDGVSKENLAINRYEMRQRAETSYPFIARLWGEFDESLVGTTDSRLFNTLDAEHFFNAKTLATGLSSSRLLAGAPSFLTAIGVLGTFFGLTVGLSGLQIDATDVGALKTGVSTMINGASAAFLTSILGVCLSLLLNIAEKIFENSALKQIKEFQERIDYLYPRITAEQSLIDISGYSKDSKESLQDLHERIGDRLQESVEGLSQTLQDAIATTLSEVLSPALSTMANNASQQSTEVLEKLVGGFMDGMREAGREQASMLDKAAADVTTSVSEMGLQMDNVLSKVTEQQANTLKQTTSVTEQLSSQVQAQISSEEKRQQAMEEQFTRLMNQFSGLVEQQMTNGLERDTKRQEAFDKWLSEQSQEQSKAVNQQIEQIASSSQLQQEAIKTIFSKTIQQLNSQIIDQNHAAAEREDKMAKNFQQQISAMAEEQQNVTKLLSEGLAKAQEQLLQLAEHNKELLKEMSAATEASEQSSIHMKESSTQLGILSVNLKTSAELLERRLADVTRSLEGASQQNNDLAAHALTQSEALIELQKSLNTATEYFSNAAKEAHSGFDVMSRHQKKYLTAVKAEFEALADSLKERVLDIESQAEQWLQKYSDEVRNQVVDRMNTWNETTVSFAARMKETVESLNGVVDDLERR